MKKNYLILMLVFLSTFITAQNNDFNNQGGDLLWSNTANWSLTAVPISAHTVRLPLIVESQVDLDVTILKLQTIFGTAADLAVAGNNTVTINPNAANGIAIENASNNNIKLSLKGKIAINNPGGFSQIRNANGTTNSIEFTNGSLLTLTTGLDVTSGSSKTIIFNGSLNGSGNLRFGANSETIFGTTGSNPDYTGELVALLNSIVTVNTADNITFYKGLKIQVNGNNASITINGENVFQSGITVGGVNTYTFNVNKNQSAMTNLIFQGAGTLNMVVGSNVTNLTFADNSANVWSTGSKLNITGYKPGVIRFGTDANGLTATQLSQITVDGSGGAVALDSNGYLVNASSLSVDEFLSNTDKQITYPTITSNNLYFKSAQSGFKIYDISGRVLITNKAENQTEVNVNTLPTGMYFIRFDSNRTEKFIKR